MLNRNAFFTACLCLLGAACTGTSDPQGNSSSSGASTSGSSSSGTSKVLEPQNRDEQTMARGRNIWRSQCASCHGDTGQGGSLHRAPVNFDLFSSRTALVNHIFNFMPKSAQDPKASCRESCANDVADFMLAGYPEDPTQIGLSCDEKVGGKPLLRRLSQDEFNATVNDLLGEGSAAEVDFIGLTTLSTFIGANAVGDSAEVSSQVKEAERLADLAMNGLPELSNANGLSKAQVEAFLSNFGLKVFRRPLSTEESERYIAIYDSGKSFEDNKTGIHWMLASLFGSPHFVYHTEATREMSEGDSRILLPYEVANRLAYFLTGTMPDETLLKAAADNKLSNISDIETQARRLANTAEGKNRLVDFLLQWLRVRTLDDKTDLERFGGEQNAKLGADLLLESLEATLRRAIDTNGYTLNDLLTSSEFVVSAELAQMWGGDAAGNSGVVDLSSEKRYGIFTHPAVLSVHATTGFATPTFRGNYLLDHLVCDPVPPPPPSVIAEFPDVDGSLPDREALAMHNAKEECAFCHANMDPLGFAFGNFDSQGRYQTEQKGKPVDTADVADVLGVQIAFNDTTDLMPQLASLPEVRDCMGKHVLRFAFGRDETRAEACSVEQYTEIFANKNESVSELLISFVTTETFLRVNSFGSK